MWVEGMTRILAPFQRGSVIGVYQGWRSLSLAYPWLPSFHAFGVKRIASRFKLKHYLPSAALAPSEADWDMMLLWPSALFARLATTGSSSAALGA